MHLTLNNAVFHPCQSMHPAARTFLAVYPTRQKQNKAQRLQESNQEDQGAEISTITFLNLIRPYTATLSASLLLYGYAETTFPNITEEVLASLSNVEVVT